MWTAECTARMWVCSLRGPHTSSGARDSQHANALSVWPSAKRRHWCAWDCVSKAGVCAKSLGADAILRQSQKTDFLVVEPQTADKRWTLNRSENAIDGIENISVSCGENFHWSHRSSTDEWFSAADSVWRLKHWDSDLFGRQHTIQSWVDVGRVCKINSWRISKTN